MVVPVLQVFQPQLSQNPIHPGIGFFPGKAIVPGPENHILIYRGHEHLVVRILEHKADLLPDWRQILFGHRHPVHQDFPLGRQQTQHQLHNGGFSRAIGADEAHRLPLADVKAQIVKHRCARFIGKGNISKFQHIVTS